MRGHITMIAGAVLGAIVLTGCQSGNRISDSVGNIFTRDSGPDRTVAPVNNVNLDDGGEPFGTAASVAYAALIWDAMDNDLFVGPDTIVTYPYQGTMPHGELLEIYTSYARINGHEGMLIIKKNYMGDGITSEMVANDPDTYLDAVTIMFQREAGYDPDNRDWFWAKYGPDGTIMTNPMSMSLAGRVAKGADEGCIACHLAAPGGDYVFSHDRLLGPFAGN
jgi:hypothetical protein